MHSIENAGEARSKRKGTIGKLRRLRDRNVP
jgi:hypothetical protein